MKRSALLALILVYIAMLASSYISASVFDRLPHLEDEIAYLYQAKIFAGGRAYIETPEPRRAYWQPFVVDCTRSMDEKYHTECNSRRFGKYTPGWSMLLAFGTLNNLPFVVNMWLSGLVVALVYRLARELYNDVAGVSAAILMTISPIALILNGSLMAHTAAMFFTMLFIYGLWRVERKRHVYFWAGLAGFALGMLIVTRPLTAAGIALPFILYSGLRLAWLGLREIDLSFKELSPRWGHAFIFMIGLMILIISWTLEYIRVADLIGQYEIKFALLIFFTAFFTIIISTLVLIALRFSNQFFAMLKPLLVLAFFTLMFAAIYPAFNYHVTGNPGVNMYRMIWDYDRIGFGFSDGKSGYGRSGHSIYKGWNILKKDTDCYARDLFGWVEQPDNPPDEIAQGNDCLRDKQGLSPALLLPGLLLFRRRIWTGLLLAGAAFLIASQMTYWIGAGVYSARYYYEATGLLAVVSGAGVAGLVSLASKQNLQSGIYALFGIAIAISVIGYTPERFEPIRKYGCIDDEPINIVNQLRGDEKALVVSYGQQEKCKSTWRDLGALMAVTDPYENSDIILVRDPDKNLLDQLIEKYPDRTVILMINNEFQLPGEE